MAKTSWRHYCILVLLIAIIVIVIQFLILNAFVYIPNARKGASISDSVIVGQVPTMWCHAQEVEAPFPFTAYKVNKYPSIDQDANSTSTNHFFQVNKQMGWGDFAYVRTYMLQGSSIEVSSCSSEPGARVSVVTGGAEFEHCLKNLHAKRKDADEDTSDSKSSEESEEVPVIRMQNLHSKGVLPPSIFALCPHTRIANKKIQRANQIFVNGTLTGLECEAENENVTGTTLRVNKTTTDYYYIIVHNYNFAGINNIRVNISLSKTHYALGEASQVCKDTTRCTIPLKFASRSEIVIVEFPPQKRPQDGAGSPSRIIMFDVTNTCKQRLSFYFLLFSVIPLIFGVLAAFLYRMTRNRIQVQKHLIVPGTEATETVWVDLETSKAPLLKNGKIKWPTYTSIFSASKKQTKRSQCVRSDTPCGFTPLQLRIDSKPHETSSTTDGSLPSYDEVVVFDRSIHLQNQTDNSDQVAILKE